MGEERLGNSAWAHNPEHRLGVPYANREVAGRFARNGACGGRDSAAPGPQSFNRGQLRASAALRKSGF